MYSGQIFVSDVGRDGELWIGSRKVHVWRVLFYDRLPTQDRLRRLEVESEYRKVR